MLAVRGTQPARRLTYPKCQPTAMGRLAGTLGVTNSLLHRISVSQIQMQVQCASKTSVPHEAAKVLGITPNPASGNFRSQRLQTDGQQELKPSIKRRPLSNQAFVQMQNASAASSAGPLRRLQVQKCATVITVVIANQCGQLQGVAGSSWHPTGATPNPFVQPDPLRRAGIWAIKA